jgi:uncharacterized protein (DUF433 family)
MLVHLRYANWRKIQITDGKLIKRINADPSNFGGKPVARGMRISVELILSLLAQGETTEEILKDYPELEVEDIKACPLMKRFCAEG